MDWLLSDPVLPFSVALLLMVTLGLLELAALLFGAGLSTLVDHWLPDLDHIHPDAMHFPEHLLTWLCLGRVPFLMLLVIFLSVFGLSGICLQAALDVAGLNPWPAAGAALPAAVTGLLGMHHGGELIARLLPPSESESVSGDSFIGRTAVITVGEARVGAPAEARLTDTHGHVHYVLIIPDSPELVFTEGREVLICRREGSLYRAVPDLDFLLRRK